MPSPPIDRYHRRIDYLRISITDRCNLRCIYCMPPEGVPRLRHEDILSYEEIIRLVKLAVRIGISKVRITGGEPLVRRDVVYLCKEISSITDVSSISITTNGVRLAEFAEPLYKAGIKRINVSLDTLKRERFLKITRRDAFELVWEGILEAYRIGFHPIKINVVAMAGINDDEIEELAMLTYRYPFHIRFIEFMPLHSEAKLECFLSGDEILARLRRIGSLEPATSLHTNGPAKHYKFHGALGKIGINSPLSHHFCSTCNRLRVTADGKLRTCLFATKETDLKVLLRNGASEDQIIAVVRNAISQKPKEHNLDKSLFRKCLSRPMSSIGG